MTSRATGTETVQRVSVLPLWQLLPVAVETAVFVSRALPASGLFTVTV